MVRFVMILESQLLTEVRNTVYVPAKVAGLPSGKSNVSPWQIVTLLTWVIGWKTVKSTVTIESHPEVDVKITGYKPAVFVEFPSGNK